MRITEMSLLRNGIDVLMIKGGLDMEKIKNIWFDNNRIYMRTQSNKTFSRPLEAYPELMDATTEQRNDYVIGDDGEDIRWESLDADMHISSFLETSEKRVADIKEALHRFGKEFLSA